MAKRMTVLGGYNLDEQGRVIRRYVDLRLKTGDLAYRGYLIRHNALNASWWIEKDGANISSCDSQLHGQQIVDSLVGD